ncbi:hypothetical protein C2W64_04123 [Brevibacillus laterosporus]|nr:hypothetical protein C2W64_04123 [Brevibacillus laterosporus]
MGAGTMIYKMDCISGARHYLKDESADLVVTILFTRNEKTRFNIRSEYQNG